jgi:hypothetical protein
VELEAAAVGALALVVYALGACPTIYVGDSGELVAAVDTLGIPHPSGYPLYVLLGKLWTPLLPVGSVAHRTFVQRGVRPPPARCSTQPAGGHGRAGGRSPRCCWP